MSYMRRRTADDAPIPMHAARNTATYTASPPRRATDTTKVNTAAMAAAYMLATTTSAVLNTKTGYSYGG